MVTSPAEGMAAAPIAASVAVKAMISSWAKPRVTPCACSSQAVSHHWTAKHSVQAKKLRMSRQCMHGKQRTWQKCLLSDLELG